jgi:hypothetical protein
MKLKKENLFQHLIGKRNANARSLCQPSQTPGTGEKRHGELANHLERKILKIG